jgi:hypothetical protein
MNGVERQAALIEKARGDRAYYFGTARGDAGHYLWNVGGHERMRSRGHGGDGKKLDWGDPDIPWERLDGGMCPPVEREGECLWYRKDGWSAIAFANRTDDSRGNSNSVFMFERELNFAGCVRQAEARFPDIIKRFDFPLVLVNPRCGACGHWLTHHRYTRCQDAGCGCKQLKQVLVTTD